jgi:hypothetical protein
MPRPERQLNYEVVEYSVVGVSADVLCTGRDGWSILLPRQLLLEIVM